MTEEFDVNQIVEIKQLPKIFSQLEQIGKYIDKNTQDLDKLECTEENKQEVKNRRYGINNTLNILENKRKEIKNSILKEYNEFETKYNEECKSKLENASKLLTEKINFIEDTQKENRRKDLMLFFENYKKSYNLDGIINFDDVNLNITLSASDKKLQTEIINFCEKVSNDIKAIQSDEDSADLLLEYKNNGFDYSKAKISLNERKKALEEYKNQIQQTAIEIKEEEKVVQNVNTLVSPPVEVKEEKRKKVTITAMLTDKEARELQEWFKVRNIEFI